MILSFKKLCVFIFSCLVLFSAQSTLAADLNLSPSSGSYKVGDTISVRIVLSSPGQSANAVSGSLIFSKDLLTLNSVSKSGSLISLWAQEPSYSNSSGTVDLEGIMLTGYTGSSGNILTLSFKAKAVGSANVKFSSSSVLANDGQGTNILSGVGQANFSITKAEAKPPVTTPVVEAPAVKEKVAPNIQIQELKKKENADLSTKFLITSTGKKTKSEFKVFIDDVAVSWNNQDSGVFETPILLKGNHVLKVSMETINNDNVSNTANFALRSVATPSFTEYSDTIKEKDYIVVKGLTDPNIDVYVNVSAVLNNTTSALSDVDTIVNNTFKVTSDDKGLFIYVSEKVNSGIYNISAYAKAKNGGESANSESIKINVVKSGTVVTSVVNTFSMLVPIVALIILLIIIATWGWYKVLHYRENMRKKLAHAKALVSKSFGILEEDAEEQLKILKKIKGLQPLSAEEKVFINQFKKDIESAEQVISKEIKEV